MDTARRVALSAVGAAIVAAPLFMGGTARDGAHPITDASVARLSRLPPPAEGLPFGPFHLRDSVFHEPFTAAVRSLDPRTAVQTLEAARRAHVRLVVRLQQMGLGLATSLNALDGGAGASGLRGVGAGRWAMSADELQRWGRVLAAEPYACGLFMWKYDRDDPAYFQHPNIRAAVAVVAEAARSRKAPTCVGTTR